VTLAGGGLVAFGLSRALDRAAAAVTRRLG
jgi:hypothetical protein